MPEQLDHAAGYSLVSPVPKRDGRTLLVGDPPVGAPEHQDLDQLAENQPVGNTWLVAAERMSGLSLGQEDLKLLPDGLDDVWFKRGHRAYSFYLGSLEAVMNSIRNGLGMRET